MMAESLYYSQIDDQSEDIDYEGSIEEDIRTMKIDHMRARKSTSEPPFECKVLIDRLKKCNRLQLLEELSKINTWTFGKCELGHWKEVLHLFDAILDEATESHPENKWALNCDWKYNISDKKLLLWILHFTTLLIEHSFSRHTYKSMDKLLVLLGSSDMCVVLGVLNLLYIFSKRSNFITRMHPEQRSVLISRLHHLAESWGGKENGFGLADCCSTTKPTPPSASTLHFEFHNEQSDSKDSKSKQNMTYIHVPHVDQIRKMPAEIMKSLLSIYTVPADKEMLLFTHLRLAYHFSNYRNRLLCVQARLQALSVLVYANALQDSAHTLLYNGLLEELVELIELKFPYLVEIRSAALRTLTSIIHLDRNPHFPKKPGSRLNNIIDVTGANQYHGFLPVLVRHCISCLTSTQNNDKDKKTEEKPEPEEFEEELVVSEDDTFPYLNTQTDYKGKFPQPLATALFSFLYHLASYESGGDALVSCGMMESLLQVINWHGVELEHITFVTRAVRVIDLITNIDMQAFYTHSGLQSFINRLDAEVNLCVKEHLYEFKHIPSDDLERPGTSDGTTMEESSSFEFQYNPENSGKICLPQRAALLKSMLNFLKKALQDSTFSEHIRHLMEGTLPNSLKHIISNAEYYGPSLFLLATDVVTVYVFQEPSLLSTIQDNGLTDVVLQALLIKDVPATREVLASLPNVFSALCLNSRGLASFAKCKPFERLFKVLLSPTYLSAMLKRRSSDPMGDAASNLGNSMDELMRHQPSLKVDAIAAIIKLLNELCQLGTDPKYICWRRHSKTETSPATTQRSTSNTEGSSDDEEDDDEEEASTSSQTAQAETQEAQTPHSSEKTPIALTEYILNVTKFIDAILSNNSTDDHCKEFVNQGGLVPLLKILGLPNLPVDCPVTNSAQAVASVCKSILNLAHEPKVLEQGLTQLEEVLTKLKPLYSYLNIPGGSKLLHELANAPHLESAFSTESATPLLHAMGAAHGYVLMFVHVCRTGQNEIRTLSLQHWGSEKGIQVLKCLAELYTSLVWESTLLLALCSDDVIPSDCDFGREDMEKLNVPVEKPEPGGDTTGNVASAMEALTTNPPTMMDVDSETQTGNKPTSQQLRYIKPLLGASSRLGRALAELFGLLVKLCVGSPTRQRRGQNMIPTPAFPSPHAQSVATALNSLLANGLNSEKLPQSPVPKFRLTFLICSVGFTSPMLFDEKRYPYHLMLQKFVSLGGQATFFNTFRWALSAGGTVPLEEGIEYQNLPEGTGEFLDAWLTLLEKMVNPKAILDSPHVITTKSQTAFKAVAFDPLKYLIQIHKLAFEAVMFLWGKKPLPGYGIRMSESILSILRHILRGEKIIKDRLNKQDEKAGEPAATPGTGTSSSTTTASRPESDVERESLRQLMDMGFTREHAIDALLHTMNIEQATEYILTHPQTMVRTVGMDLDMSEDDQVIQAIAISLGEAGPSTEPPKKKEDDDITPLSDEQIDNFTEGALQICLDLVEVIPESVFKVCDLLVTITKRKGPEFRDQLLKDFCDMLLKIYLTYESSSEQIENSELFTKSTNSLRLAYYTHLYTLFFEVPPYFDMKGPCGLAMYNSGLIPHFIKLIGVADKVLKTNEKATVPKWLTPIILLLDSLGKVAVSTKRKRNMHLVTKRVWKWYDVVSGKWQTYSAANNKVINEAYWNGEQTTRITCGRRRYTISFTNMQQINEESSNNRPICMTPINLTLDRASDGKPEFFESKEMEEVTLTEKEEKRCVPIPGFTQEQSHEIVKSCVKLMNSEIDKDTLHAIMRLCLRLTQDFDIAKIFVVEGGVSCLIQLKESMAFIGFRTLATLLIRHTLEGPSTLAYAMEKVMRGRALPSTPPPYKELMFMLRSLGSAVSRDPETFLDVAKQTLRIDISSFRRSDEADTRMPMKTEPSSRTQAPMIKESPSVDVIYELLNTLILPIDNRTPEEENVEATRQQSSQTSGTRESMCQRASLLLSSNPGNSDVLNVDSQEDTRPRPSGTQETPAEVINGEPSHRTILAKHNILKILADAVVSYTGVAKIITEYSFKAKSSEDVAEDCTCLAFLFDKILPIVDEISDRDCSVMCKNLISGIASCNHSPDAQATLVTEVKAALIRALLLPESSEKHKRIQHITTMILNMIEQCPPVQQVRIFKAQTFNANVNNIARLMLRKGIFNDLARVPHCLDMSSPNFPNTINSALKPMECLSKIVNQPITGNITGNVTKKRQRLNLDDNGTTHSGTTSTEATNAQGEEAVEDTENTEHDLSAVASSLEGNPTASNAMDDNVLVIMEQLLERGPNLNSTMEIDDDTNMGYDHERDATEELMSTDSGESEDEVDDDDNDDENEVDDGDGDGDDNDEEDDDDEDLDEGDDDDEDNNYDDFENVPNMDRDEDIVMIQYPDDSENDSLPVVRWNDNGFAIPLFEDAANTSDQTAPTTHPLLVSRHNSDNNTAVTSRTQRANRPRRYQYLQLGARSSHPPVILQRLLGPTAQNIHLGSNQMLNSPGLRDSARVVVMDNFGIFPSVEEQIDFVDQSGYLFGPSMMATINHIPVALHWWKEESRFIDGDSVHDVVTYICNRLVPTLLKHKCIEVAERKKKTEQEEKQKMKFKPSSDDSNNKEDTQEQSTAGNSATASENRAENMDNSLFDMRQEERPPSEGFMFSGNLPSPPRLRDFEEHTMPEVNVDQQEERDEHDDEEPEDDSEDTQGVGSSLFPNVYQRSYSFVNSPNLLRPMFHYPLGGEATTETNRETTQQTDPQPVSELPSAPPPTNDEDSSTSPASSEQASTSQDQATATSDNARNSETNEEIPEGVDPSFLDALPPEMRREVLEQHRLLRLQQRISSSTTVASTSDQAQPGPSNEVSPEFLAALPPSLQQEVLTQQRLEQQRQAAAHANPDEPVDAGAFFETLQPSLRTMILSDMEESQMSVLPPDLAAEAQNLRRDWEARNRQMVQERFFHSNLTTIIRHSARGGRLNSRFNNLLPHRQQWSWGPRGGDMLPQSGTSGNIRIRGRQLLDHESLSCLLVLLFVDDPKLNTGRLHRVIRNLCYHIPTRDWVVKALLSIIDRSVHVKPDDTLNKPKRLPRPGPLTSKLLTDSKNMGNGAYWLNIRMEAALGCHANVFIVNKVSGKRTNSVTITIHPQAAPIVCRNALDLFTSLSRSFPTFLLPLKPKDKSKTTPPMKFKSESTDFWDMLLKLDAASTKKGKSLAKTHSNLNLNSETENTALSFEQSAFGQLLVMLSSPVIQGSIPLTDKLLRLLSVISMGMPELSKSSDSSRANRVTSQNFESVSAPEAALNLAVNVLTYKSCSEEGLEEVTTLLLNLSNCSLDMSFIILNLLLKGALRIGEIVRTQINAMLEELRNVHKYQSKAKPQDEVNPSTSKGVVNNRFTKEAVVITASTKVKTSCELQLPSMIPLTSKSSSQLFFLRVLRVIVQICDAINKSLEKEERPTQSQLHPLSEQVEELENLWNTLSQCLLELEHTPDHHAVLVLQPAVEAFFLIHSPLLGSSNPPETSPKPSTADPIQDPPEGSSQSQGELNTSDGSSGRASVPPDQQNFLNFAEKHRTVLNQILRQSTAHLADGPFSVLVDHTRVLDFDIKRRYFRTELERLDQNIRREETAVHVRREHVFEDSFRELYRRTPEEWKNRFYIVFEDEEGQDAGGLLREWYMIISRDIFNPMYALFTVSPGDRVTYMINSASHYNPNHLCYYKFVGRVIAKAIYDNKLLECYFTRSFYKHILGISVKFTDMESEDYSFYRGLVYLMENNINDLGCDLTFSTEINEFGVTETRDLIPNGRNVPVTEENKMEYVRRSCQMKMTGAIRQQLTAFLEGFYDIIPKRLISIFNEQELELLISGLPNVDIEDLKANTEYHKYQATSLQIQWFWRALRSFDQADRAKFLQFVTGTSKVPLQGFGALEGMNGVQKFQIHRDDRSTDRLPSAHTCFNQLDLPVYETYDKLRSYLLKAIHECSEGFGFA